jgi:hypothetical protein
MSAVIRQRHITLTGVPMMPQFPRTTRIDAIYGTALQEIQNQL